MREPRVFIGPNVEPWLRDAVVAGGGEPVSDHRRANAIVWRGSDSQHLGALLDQAPDAAWIQLGAAGTDAWAPTGLFHDGRVWTSAKGAYSEAVAEHALTLMLALLRDIPRFSGAWTWLPQSGCSLFERTVLIMGAEGGIGHELVRLLEPFRVRVLSGRRDEVRDLRSDRSLTFDDALGEAEIVIIATPLTARTRHLIGREQFATMRSSALVINIARGGVVDTDALVDALKHGEIAGAALDVTDPEPLPEGHPLWPMANCLITPHTANTTDMLRPKLARRITENVRRFADDLPLFGVVDAVKGY